MKNLLAVVLVVSVASVALSQFAPPPTRAEVAPNRADGRPAARWNPETMEYKVSDRGGFNAGDWQKKLNDLARDGWELVTVDEGHYILRRPVQPNLAAPGGAIPAFAPRPNDIVDPVPDGVIPRRPKAP